MFDLSFQIERERLAAVIAADVEAQSIEAFKEDEPRWHLGASVIGGECDREAWQAFRWVKQEQLNGRQYRLFNRGHAEEAKIIALLRGVGFEVYDVDENDKQFRISGHKGHYGGSLDSVAIAPARYGLPGPLLIEYKTHSDKSFTKLAGPAIGKYPNLKRDSTKAEGVRKSKPQHFSQMCSYGQAYNLPYALYCAVDKDTDELYFEIVALDFNHGVNLYQKAGNIIFSQVAPKKISQSPAYFYCKTLCAFYANCHHSMPPEVNCRSCENATPVDNGQWHCRVHDGIIRREQVLVGCPQWKRIV